jgi:hypothetical protein
MNRKQRRAAAKTGGHNHGGDNLCPGCNASAVILHCLENEVTTADGNPVVYYLGEEAESKARSAIFDFSVLALRLERQTAVVTVTSFGEEVFRMNPRQERVEIDKRGPWVKTLAAIAADLDAKFGRGARMQHHEQATRDSECEDGHLECQGPDFEDAAREAIAKSGQFILGVFGEPDAPWFNYTIGNYQKGLPELLIVYPGSKKMYERLAGTLNRAGEIQRERGQGFEHGELVSLGGRLPVKIVDATAQAKVGYTFGVAHYYGTDDYQVRQIVMPDPDGRYPGDPLCAEAYASLPVLSSPAN